MLKVSSAQQHQEWHGCQDFLECLLRGRREEDVGDCSGDSSNFLDKFRELFGCMVYMVQLLLYGNLPLSVVDNSVRS